MDKLISFYVRDYALSFAFNELNCLHLLIEFKGKYYIMVGIAAFLGEDGRIVCL